MCSIQTRGIKFLSAILGAIFFGLIFVSKINAAPSITVSGVPGAITAGDGFTVSVSLSGLDANILYRVKSVGDSPEATSKYKVDTLGDDLTSWLAWNGKWLEMPKVSANASGSAQLNIKSRFHSDFRGEAVYQIKIARDSDTSNANVSDEFKLVVNPATSPSPSTSVSSSDDNGDNISPSPSPSRSPSASPKATTKPTPSPINDDEASETAEVLAAQTESSASPSASPQPEKKPFRPSLPLIISISGVLFLLAASFPLIKSKIKWPFRKKSI